MTKIFRHGSQKKRHNAISVMVLDIVMDWASCINHHRLIESVTILDRHSRAQGLVSPTKPIFYDEK